MSTGEDLREKRELSSSQQKIYQLVSKLATRVDNIKTTDVVAWGEIEIWPNRILRAQIIDSEVADGPAAGIEDLYFGLEVLDENRYAVEEIGIDMDTNYSDYVFDETVPYHTVPGGAPDYAIESFMDRWNLSELLDA